MNGFLESGETPGNFDSFNSSGRIIAEKDFPIFNPTLSTNDYFVGETVKSTSSTFTGTVDEWDSINKLLKISSNQTFEVGEIIEGSSSNTRGLSSEIITFDSYYNLNSSSKVKLTYKSII